MPTTRSQTKKIDLASSQDTGATPYLMNEAAWGPVLEWLDLDYSETSPLKRIEWRNALNQIQEADGCRYITFSCPEEEPQKLWIIIQWSSAAQRNCFHQSDNVASNAKKILYPISSGISDDGNKVHLIDRVDYSIGKVIHAGFPASPNPEKVHEVWMACFPVGALKHQWEQEQKLPLLLNFYARDEESSNHMAGILSQSVAWISGEVNYQGIRCQRIAWLMEWKSKEAEELYKTTVRWVKEEEGQSSKPQLALNMFIDDLKSFEMVGYETWHAQFEDIRDTLNN